MRRAGPHGVDAVGAAVLLAPFDALVWRDLLDPMTHAKRARIVSVQPCPAVLDLAGPVARVRARIALRQKSVGESEEHDQKRPPTRPRGPSSSAGVSPSREGPGEILEVCKPPFGHAAARQIGAGAIHCGPGSSAVGKDTPQTGRKLASYAAWSGGSTSLATCAMIWTCVSSSACFRNSPSRLCSSRSRRSRSTSFRCW